MMPAPLAEEVAALRELGLRVDVIEESPRFFVILKDFHLLDGHYVPPVTDLMVIADYQYPMSKLDMYWTDPPVKTASGAVPQAAGEFENHGGRRWQRWSWHYPVWDPAKHNVRTHIEVFRDRLARGC